MNLVVVVSTALSRQSWAPLSVDVTVNICQLRLLPPCGTHLLLGQGGSPLALALLLGLAGLLATVSCMDAYQSDVAASTAAAAS